ncbi:MAG: hypothetical protein AB7V55_03845 [Oscillospiraceae bacterium]
MKIDTYAIHTSAQRSYQKLEMQSAQLSLWGSGSQAENGDLLSLSDLAKQLMEDARQNSGQWLGQMKTPETTQTAPAKGGPMTKEELKLQLLDSFLFALTGRRLNTRTADPATASRPQHQLRPLNIRAGFGGQVRVQQLQYEHEAVAYQAKGVVNTADGKSIQVDLSMQMSRTFYSYASMNLEFGAKPIDPIVINYGGTAASLTGETFAFDLDFDGQMDQIAFAGPGSGFLAWDKNGDGAINDGSELFGPSSGCGFGELRTYDTDGNGWLDEGDAIFSQLRIWSRDADGNDQLYTLAELNIGALYLGEVATEFAMKDAANNTQGIMRSTSFFLREDGSAGTVSHIDLMA